MMDPELVKQLRVLHTLGWGTKRIAKELGVARNSVRRYLRCGPAAETQRRPWSVHSMRHSTRVAELLDGAAQGNGIVVKRLLAKQEIEVPLQRALAPHRRAKQAAAIATVRFETSPGEQMQVDFDEKWVEIDIRDLNERGQERHERDVRWIISIACVRFDHQHSGIRFATPSQRHGGHDIAILVHRVAVYREARRRNPQRWTGGTRDWSPISTVRLNPEYGLSS